MKTTIYLSETNGGNDIIYVDNKTQQAQAFNYFTDGSDEFNNYISNGNINALKNYYNNTAPLNGYMEMSGGYEFTFNIDDFENITKIAEI